MTRSTLLYVPMLCLVSLLSVSAQNWPTFQMDNQRSGYTPSEVSLPLNLEWSYSAPTPPQTAWPDPARWDSYAHIKDLKSMRDFDPVFYVTSSDGRVYFGSSVDDSVHCLNGNSGQREWQFFTDAPVRIPPTIHENKLYFASDDGHAYCIDAVSGEEIWRYNASGSERLIPSNGKLISPWPVRTGVLIEDGIAYFGASLVPWEPSYVCAVDAETGSDQGEGLYRHVMEGMTLQGVILASTRQLYFSQGRQHPLVFERQQGELVGGLGSGGNGGVFAILTPESTLIHGRGKAKSSDTEFRGFDPETGDQVASFPNATAMVIKDTIAYLHTAENLLAFDRFRYLEIEAEERELFRQRNELTEQVKELGAETVSEEKSNLLAEIETINKTLETLGEERKGCILWQTPSDHAHTLIMAGDTLFAGGENEVAAFDRNDGTVLDTIMVEGGAHGLAVADGKLFISTDLGHVYSFGSVLAEQ